MRISYRHSNEAFLTNSLRHMPLVPIPATNLFPMQVAHNVIAKKSPSLCRNPKPTALPKRHRLNPSSSFSQCISPARRDVYSGRVRNPAPKQSHSETTNDPQARSDASTRSWTDCSSHTSNLPPPHPYSLTDASLPPPSPPNQYLPPHKSKSSRSSSKPYQRRRRRRHSFQHGGFRRSSSRRACQKAK